ncbi:MAG TPA: AAA family ATPase [Myxococcaceae bacterium]|nr:AAA family ATPase [Myxococcaceae bacterium]
MVELNQLKSIYERHFIPVRDARWPQWRKDYLHYVTEVQRTDLQTWMTPRFQEYLWEDDGVSTAGLGATVIVRGAYTDKELAQALFDLRDVPLEKEPVARAKQLQGAYDRIMGMVTPRHNERRPGARLIRIFAGLFPKEVLCLLDSHRTHVVRRAFGMKKAGMDTIAQHVLIRQALRDQLEEPRELQDAVDQSIFSWYLYELAEKDRAQKSQESGEVAIEEIETGSAAPAPPRLKLLPFDDQRKGIFHVPKAISTVTRMIRSAEHGATREEVLAAIREVSPGLKNSSAEQYLSLLRGTLGLLELRDGALRPTSRGQQLIEGEDPSDVLAPSLIAEIFGFAQVLWMLRTAPQGRAEVIEQLRAWYPRWTTTQIPTGVLSWSKEIGLVEEFSGPDKPPMLRLTEAGAYWASGLPADLETRWTAAAVEEPEAAEPAGIVDLAVESSSTSIAALEEVPFEELRNRFDNDPALKSLVFSREFIRLFDMALRANGGKRFVLLAGLSGTGKTSLARAYARAYCDARGISFGSHYLEVAVRPDWTDPTGLLGYYNPIQQTARYEETAVLRHLQAAVSNPTKPYFLCLDEMNLARVEHYFAPFLSAMEGRDGVLQIHSEPEEVDSVPPRLPWPRNLFIVGTVNMDETTHAFSDKVLDRAFSFELWDVDLAGWRSRAQEAGARPEVLERVFPVLQALYQALYPARRHFGYRTCNEVLSFCGLSVDGPLEPVLDAAVLAKVLPKLRGDDAGPLPRALDEVRKVCEQFQLRGSAAKVELMAQSLKSMGVARYWM